jgi:hypothetical protein
MPTAPTYRVLADFAYDALYLRLIKPEQVVAWADSMIAATEAPPEWMIELSMVDQSDILAIFEKLRAVPGQPGDQSLSLLNGLVWREWSRNNLTIGRVRGIGWEIHRRHPGRLDYTSWGIAVDDDFGVSLDEGHITEAQMCDAISRLLGAFSQDALALPHWA